MSSQNIMQLMTHLNDFEVTITHVVFEMATRLAALFDANFFLMFENRDGRKLCGSTSLIDEYVQGSLRALDTDQIAAFEARPTLDGKFVHLLSHGPIDCGTENNGHVLPQQPFDPLDLSCEMEEETNARRPRQKRKSKDDIHAETLKKRLRTDYDDVIIEDARNENQHGLVQITHVDSDENDSRISEIDGSLLPMPLAPYEPRHIHHPRTDVDPCPLPSFELDLMNLNLPFNKIEMLQTIVDPSLLFVKDGVEFKLLNSILYDFGKELGNSCPYFTDGIKAKVFFHQNFKNFILMFPSLKAELISDIRIAKKSAEAHLKNNARAGFNSVFDKKKKYS